MTASSSRYHIAIEKSIAELNQSCRKHLAEGYAPERVSSMRHMVGATLLSYADIREAVDDPNYLMVVMTIAFANAAATFIDTFADNVDEDSHRVASDFIERLTECVSDLLADPPDNITKIDRDETGS